MCAVGVNGGGAGPESVRGWQKCCFVMDALGKMNDFATRISEFTVLLFPREWVNAALMFALMSTWAVIALFIYMNRTSRKPHFSLWTVAWMFYAVYLAASIGLEQSPDSSFLVMVQRASIGVGALFMFWGSFQLTGQPRDARELKMASLMMVVWSCVAAYVVRDRLWITVPVFVLLAGAGAYTGALYLLRRKRYRGGSVLGAGFMSWGLLLLAFPLFDRSTTLMTIGYFASAILSVVIAMGMIVEQEVSLSEQNYRVLFDWASDSIFLLDLKTLHVIDANWSAQRLADRNLAKLQGMDFLELCPDLRKEENGTLDCAKMFAAMYRQSTEFRLLRPNRTWVQCEGTANVAHSHKRPVLQISVREVTERKKVELQLRQAEKLSAMGRLMAGVAHELNNPLAVVMGYSELLMRQENIDGKVKGDLKTIFRESERAGKIVGELLKFVRPCEPMKVAADINRLVANVLEARESFFKAAGVQLAKSLAPQLSKTKADPDQIEQIVTNLVTNATHAMAEHKGTRVLKVATEEDGLFVRITVADTGPGIPKEILPRIFEPFFSTKSLG